MKEINDNLDALIKQSLISQLTDEEMSMPDIEEEMKRIKASASSQPAAATIIPMSQPRISFRKVAAAITALLLISGVAIAAIKYGGYFKPADTPSQTIIADTIPDQKPDVPEEIVFDNSYLAEMLDTISSYYDMKVVFANNDLRIIRLHYTFNPAKSIDKVIRDLNHFNKMTITRQDSVINVTPKQQ